MKLIEEKNFILMGLNNQIAALQARFENAKIKSLECEQLVLQIKNNAVCIKFFFCFVSNISNRSCYLKKQAE